MLYNFVLLCYVTSHDGTKQNWNRVHRRPIHAWIYEMIHEHGIPPFSRIWTRHKNVHGSITSSTLPFPVSIRLSTLSRYRKRRYLPRPTSTRAVVSDRRCFSFSHYDSQKKCRPRGRFPRILFDWFIIRRIVSWRPIDVKHFLPLFWIFIGFWIEYLDFWNCNTIWKISILIIFGRMWNLETVVLTG